MSERELTAERWCVVLGASIGAGAAIARALARDPGLHVFGVHRGNHVEGADAVTLDVEAAERRAHFHVGDAGTAEGAAAGAGALAAVAGPGRVQMFVHSIASASVGRLATGERPLRPDQLTRTFESMAHSFVHWARALLDGGLLAPGARLLGLSNPLGAAPLDGCAAIAASKGALEIYVRYLALELGPLGYRVNLLNFGATETRAWRVAMSEDRLSAVRPALLRSTPAGRLVTADEVGRFVSVLAGDAGAWFNGANIDMTGGEALGHYNALIAAEREGEEVN